MRSYSSTAIATETPSCRAEVGRTSTRVVELCTSEGCNSCPPADRWLSGFKAADPDTVVMAFHVDYWNRLGWTDRFSSAAFSERQAQQHVVNGARFSYTTQVVIDGVDRDDWRYAPASTTSQPASVAVSLAKYQDDFVATLRVQPSAPKQLAAYWAVTEQGHVSVVKAGENEGSTLHHEFVVREYRPVTTWNAAVGTPVQFRFRPDHPADPAHPRQVDFVVIDALTGRPVQAIKLGC